MNGLTLLGYKPILYRHTKGGGVIHGINAEIIPNICDIWLKARDKKALTKPKKSIVQRAEEIMRGLAHVGIIALIDEAAGYQKLRADYEFQRILEAYVLPEHRPWVQ